MKELEEVRCEVRREIHLQHSTWDRLSNSNEDEGSAFGNIQTSNGTPKPFGGFLSNANYAWLSCESRLIVINAKTGQNISCWTFRMKITCVSPFPTLPGENPLLLVGLDNGAMRMKDSIGLVCVFDCASSRVLRAIKMPAGVEQICVIHGGAEWEERSDKRMNNILSENDGIACVVLRNLHHVMVNLQRSLWQNVDSYFLMDETSPCDVDFSFSKRPTVRHGHGKEKHAARNLINSQIENYIGFRREDFEFSPLSDERLTTVITSSRKIGCLISGCLGRVIIWQNDGTVGWISTPIDENMTVSHLALLEPSDDPRPFYYLWVGFQEESESRTAPILRMYSLLFERKYSEKGTNLYYNLEHEPSLKFELELEEGNRIVSLSTVERETNCEQSESGVRKGEDNLLLIGLNDKTLLFDLNQWYKEQMPLTAYDCSNPNSILSIYRTKLSRQQNSNNGDNVISCIYKPLSLKEFVSNDPTPAEEFFYPNSLSFEWLELSSDRIVIWVTNGIQSELLKEISTAGPTILLEPNETYHKCLSVGLIPLNTECSPNADENTQREILLSLCLEQRWSVFLLKCAREWSDGSAGYLFALFLKWGIQRASTIKMAADRLCVPLFDQSGSSIGESEVKTLRFCSQQLECLSNVVAMLPVEANDLIRQKRILKRVSTYLQVVLWFYDVGLLPETQEIDEDNLPANLQIPYPFERLAMLYKEKRERVTANHGGEGRLYIDELIAKTCEVLKSQWERESGEINIDGNYPPPSLQSLLRSYLTACHQPDINEIETKHQITLYLLMDLSMYLQGCCPSIDQLIKYPAAFKLSPSVIKLTQAFWLLDHENYEECLDVITGQLINDADIKDWQHRLMIRTLMQNDQHKLALTYLRIRKPPLSSIQEQETVIYLSVQYGLVQNAFHNRPPSHYAQLLTSFFQACKRHNKLSDILHLTLDNEEEEAFVKFLESDNSEETRLLYYLQRCRYSEASNVFPVKNNRNNGNARNIQPISLKVLNAYEATLPNVTRQFATKVTKRNLEPDAQTESFSRPMSHRKSLSGKQDIYETVIKKARETYSRSDRRQIPFISAPCLSLRFNSGGENANTSCVLYPTLNQRSNKRTLEQMEDGESGPRDERKRRKTMDHVDDKNSPKEQRGINVVFDTPLVKRRNQLIEKNETPHSILKIVGKSTSPCRDPQPETNERRPIRQIRFSLNQLQNDSSRITNDSGSGSSKSTEESFGKEKVVANSDESNDAFYSPTKSLMDSSILSSDSSINVSARNISGPRPRPSLRRSVLKSEALNDTKKWMNSSSPIISSKRTENSFSCLEDNKTALTPPKTPRARSSLCSTICSPRILSSDTSFDVTDTNADKFARDSKRDSPGRRANDGNKSQDASDRKYVEYKRFISVHTTSITKIVQEEDESNEVVMEVDDYALDKLPTKVSFAGLQKHERKSNGGVVDNNNDDEDGGKNDNDDDDDDDAAWKDRIVSQEENCETSENEIEKDESEGELKTLKDTEEESEESFQSISEERNNGSIKKPEIQEFNITDDESSKSFIESVILTLDDSNEKQPTSSSPSKVHQVVDITDDETSRESFDCPKESEPSERSQAFSQNTPMMDVEESVPPEEVSPGTAGSPSKERPAETLPVTPAKSTPEQEKDHEEEEENEMSIRVTRSRRGSSLSREMVSSPLLTPRARTRRGSSLVPEEITKTNSSGSESSVETPTMTRGRNRRSNSVAKESLEPVEPRTRSRRASSLAKELLISTTVAKVSSEETSARIPSSGSESFVDSPSKRAGRKSVATPVRKIPEAEEEAVDEEHPKVRRSARRAASVQKEILDSPKKVPASRGGRVSSSASVGDSGKEAEADEDKEGKRSRGKRASSVAKAVESEELPMEEDPTTRRTRSRRAASVSKSTEEEENARQTRSKRGSSVTKESETPSRTRKSSTSSVRDDIHDDQPKRGTRRRSESVPKELEASRKGKPNSLASEVIPEDDVVRANSPALNTRRRRSSVRSIPDEVEEALSVPSKSRLRSARSSGSQSKARRAVSEEPRMESSGRSRTRGSSRSIAEDVIPEEEVIPQRGKEEETSGTPVTPASRTLRKKGGVPSVSKRKEETDVADDEMEIDVEVNLGKAGRGGRKTSEKSSDEESFVFSPPQKIGDAPIGHEGVGNVTNYTFSPPHTRSRTPPLSVQQRDRRNMRFSFISPLSEAKLQMGSPEKPRIQKSNQVTRVTSMFTRRKAIRNSFILSARTNPSQNDQS